MCVCLFLDVEEVASCFDVDVRRMRNVCYLSNYVARMFFCKESEVRRVVELFVRIGGMKWVFVVCVLYFDFNGL